MSRAPTRGARRMSVALLGSFLAAAGTAAGQPPAPAIDFNRDVRPLLSDHCFGCHGPDRTTRKAGLRLDTKAGALAKLRSGRAAVVPGRPEQSTLVERICSTDPREQMPPPPSPKRLTPAQADLLREWVKQGAKWADHWAFVPPKRGDMPAVKNRAWPRNAVDYFVLARLEKEGLAPAPEAPRATLIRRVSLDLTGLPPTPAEVKAFLDDPSPNAYEKVVDRLLASPHHAERMALDWLDAARYADTHGYNLDPGRRMTPWRDWVIRAFHRNLPFDQFTVEQLAGDLLPGATAEQRLATGFHRNTMISIEGGLIPEESRTAYVHDRVNTTASVWLGLTAGCAQCHDHKFDPISQKEYYQLVAFFNNLEETGIPYWDAATHGNAAPLARYYPPDEARRRDELEQTLGWLYVQEAAAAEAWARKRRADRSEPAWTGLTPGEAKALGAMRVRTLSDSSLVLHGPEADEDVFTVAGELPLAEPTAVRVSLEEIAPLNGERTLGALLGPPVLSAACLALLAGMRRRRAVLRAGQLCLALYAGVGTTLGPSIYEDAWLACRAPAPAAAADAADEPEVEILRVAVGDEELDCVPAPTELDGAADAVVFRSLPGHGRDGAARVAVTFRVRFPDGPARACRVRVALTGCERLLEPKFHEDEIARREEELERRDAGHSVMVMAEMPRPRETRVLLGGAYDRPGERVEPDVPAALPPLPKAWGRNRLALALWLVDVNHPLTSRVAVNRYWQLLFGTGLVATPGDFGSQGEPPSHPELLDWLALEYMHPSPRPLGTGARRGWDTRAVLRLLVTSATYRQASAVTPALLARDPQNRLLARGPRQRLPAEHIRDQALAVSGLLHREVGGEAVFPYQPAGVWEELARRLDAATWTAQKYVQSHGPDLYRRSLYTFWKRSAPPPNLTAFDAPSREVCCLRRSVTNTPLQALVLLNDPTFVEAARELGERLLAEADTPWARIDLAFRLCTARAPRTPEMRELLNLYEEQRAAFAQDRQAARKLLAVGESPRRGGQPPEELAAWTVVAQVVLNLDETITKE